jgi:hypothetical protein
LVVGLSVSNAHAATIAVTTTSMAEVNGDGCGLMEASRAVNDGARYMDCPAGNGNADTITLRTGIGVYALPAAGLSFNRNVILASAVSGTKALIEMTPNGSVAIQALPFFQTVNMELRDIQLRAQQVVPSQTGVATDGSIFHDGTTAEKVTLTRCRIEGFGGSGVSVQDMDLDIVDSVISSNSGSGGVFFLGIKNILNVRYSEVSNNNSDFSGGGIYFSSAGASTIVNSTIAANSAPNGGGIDLEGTDGAVSFKIIASTIAFNTADNQGGGVFAGGSPNYSVSETVIGNNSALAGADWFGPIKSLTNSLLQSRANNTVGTNTHNLFSVDPGFRNFAPIYTGGKYYTANMPLGLATQFLPQSPGIDFNTSSSQTDDQRHFPRGLVISSSSSKFDIGATEFDPNNQTELLNVLGQSSDTYSADVPQPEFSNGHGSNLQSDAVGDFVIYDLPMIRDECSSIAVGVRRSKESAQVQVEYNLPDENPNAWSPLGPPIDLWASAPVFKELGLVPNVKVKRASTRLRFRVVGRNNANKVTPKGYQMFLDYVKVGPPVPGNNTCFNICTTPPCTVFQ